MGQAWGNFAKIYEQYFKGNAWTDLIILCSNSLTKKQKSEIHSKKRGDMSHARNTQ